MDDLVFNREELRGVPRAKDAKDVDWSKVAATIDDLEEVRVLCSDSHLIEVLKL